ncbi:hypothetical protein [Iamia sp. SCSIO 61187]|uniref:hypothetical protein n=1 Tax=Iamia sp. SCSIO 61187 TaxID=2722752 RepID=UPI001C6250CA|nr:hypothetical protein [Iamia sp. SCSIO 61187]
MALVMVGALNVLESASRDGLEDRAASAGAPDLGPAAPVSSTTVVTTTSVPSDSSTTTAPAVSPTVTMTSSSTNDNSDWVATVVVRVVDPLTGLPVTGATVEGRWSDGATSTTECITSEQGTCPLSSADINLRGSKSVESITLTIVSVTGNGVTYTEVPPSETVDNPL